MAATPAEERSRARARRTAQHLEALAGLLGFFTLALFVTTLVAELRGSPAGALAFYLFLLAVALTVTVLAARRVRGRAGPGHQRR